MAKFDELIEKFKEVKEELNKEINYSYGRTPNMGNLGGGGSPTFGTSGGQGGMYRSEHMDKQAVAPPATMNLSEDDHNMEKQMASIMASATVQASEDGMRKMVSASPGGAQDAMVVKFDPNGQWRMEKKHIGFDKLQHKLEEEGHSKESAGNIAYSIGAKKYGKKGMSEKAHKSEETSKGEGKETKHDRCAREVKEKNPSVDNPHAVCVAAGVKPEKWKKSADEIIEKLEKHYVSRGGKNREANPKLRQSDLGPGGKVHMIRKEEDCMGKQEGTNEEANPTQPHNKGKFKVMPMEPEKSVKHLEATGLPYSGKDKDVKKGEMCPKHNKENCDCMSKSKMGHIQGNETKGFDENKAPGRETFSV